MYKKNNQIIINIKLLIKNKNKNNMEYYLKIIIILFNDHYKNLKIF